MWGWFDSLLGGLKSIWEGICSLPQVILDGIREIFIPDTQAVDDIFQSTLDTLHGKFGAPEYDLDLLFTDSVQPDSITGEYEIPGLGVMNLVFLDTTFLIKGVEFFRLFIRGFLVLLLVLYNWNQFLLLIGQDIGYTSGPGQLSSGSDHDKIESKGLMKK